MAHNQRCAELTTNKNKVGQDDSTDNERSLTDEQAVVNNHNNLHYELSSSGNKSLPQDIPTKLGTLNVRQPRERFKQEWSKWCRALCIWIFTPSDHQEKLYIALSTGCIMPTTSELTLTCKIDGLTL